MQPPLRRRELQRRVLLTTLGETGGPETVLAELGCVLKPGGRLFVGEFPINPYFAAYAAAPPAPISASSGGSERRSATSPGS